MKSKICSVLLTILALDSASLCSADELQPKPKLNLAISSKTNPPDKKGSSTSASGSTSEKKGSSASAFGSTSAKTGSSVTEAGSTSEKSKSSVQKPGSTLRPLPFVRYAHERSPSVLTGVPPAPTPKASGSPSEKTGSSSEKKGSFPDKKGSANDNDESSSTPESGEKRVARKRPRAGLVPPPPPVVPTLSGDGLMGMGSTMIFVGENIEYMPLADLLELKQRTDAELIKSRRSVEELAVLSAEKEHRAQSFDGLYAQGVVSRRELETSKREGETASRDLQEHKQALSALEQKFLRIEKRVAELEKRKKNVTKGAAKKH